MRGRLALVVVLLGVVVLTGCLSPLPPEDEIDHSGVWNTTDDVTYHLEGNTFTAVVRVDSFEGDEFEVWERDPFGGDNPVQVVGVEFRNTDGEVTEIADENIDTSGDRTVVTLPENEGRLAYIATKSSSEFTHPTTVTGSVRVHLPEGADARDFFLGGISPADYEVVSEDPLVLRWDEVERGTYVTVEHYREGYPQILILTLVVLAIVAGVVVYYYRRKLDEMEEKKMEP
jgi:hypothetical protein